MAGRDGERSGSKAVAPAHPDFPSAQDGVIGARLRSLRERLGLPAHAVERVLGLPAPTLDLMENGLAPLTVNLIPGLADIFGVTVNELLIVLQSPKSEARDAGADVRHAGALAEDQAPYTPPPGPGVTRTDEAGRLDDATTRPRIDTVLQLAEAFAAVRDAGVRRKLLDSSRSFGASPTSEDAVP